MRALSWSRGMCINALNCTHSPLIDGAELFRSTGQISKKRNMRWRLVRIHRSIDLLICTLLLLCKYSTDILVGSLTYSCFKEGFSLLFFCGYHQR